MTRALVLAAALGTAMTLPASTALASTANVNEDRGFLLEYRAAPGEANKVTITLLSGVEGESGQRVYRIDDAGASIDVGPVVGIYGCVYPDAADKSRVDCTAEAVSIIELGDGDDTFTVVGLIEIHVRGGPGSDQLRSGPAEDRVLGEEGDDLVDGGDGRDLTLLGGEGDDTVEGGGGDDAAEGGPGDDVMNGGDGNDEFDGDEFRGQGNGRDRLNGGDGNDRLDGGTGDDMMDGGPGADDLGEVNSDRSSPGCGSEVYTGGPGVDEIADECGGPNSYFLKDGERDRLFCGGGVIQRIELDRDEFQFKNRSQPDCGAFTVPTPRDDLAGVLSRGVSFLFACVRKCVAEIVALYPLRADGKKIGRSKKRTSSKKVKLRKAGTRKVTLPLTKAAKAALKDAQQADLQLLVKRPDRKSVQKAILRFNR